MYRITFKLGNVKRTLEDADVQYRLSRRGLSYNPRTQHNLSLNHEEMRWFQDSLLPTVDAAHHWMVVLECGDCSTHELGVGLSLFCHAVHQMDARFRETCGEYSHRDRMLLFLHLDRFEQRNLAISLLKAGLVATSRDWHKTFSMDKNGNLVFKEYCHSSARGTPLVQTDQRFLYLLSDNVGFPYGSLFTPFDIAICVYPTKVFPTNEPLVKVRGADVWKSPAYYRQFETSVMAASYLQQLILQEPLTLNSHILRDMHFTDI